MMDQKLFGRQNSVGFFGFAPPSWKMHPKNAFDKSGIEIFLIEFQFRDARAFINIYNYIDCIYGIPKLPHGFSFTFQFIPNLSLVCVFMKQKLLFIGPSPPPTHAHKTSILAISNSIAIDIG